MLAAILYGPNRLELTEIERPAIGDDEILARVLAAAICGTDFRIVSGKKTRGIHYPSIIGHELSGEVVEVGKKVLEFKPGDRIGIAPIVPCRKCLYCRIGLENVCANRQAIGYEFDGGFAEYVRAGASIGFADTPRRIFRQFQVTIQPRGSAPCPQFAIVSPFRLSRLSALRLTVFLCSLGFAQRTVHRTVRLRSPPPKGYSSQ